VIKVTHEVFMCVLKCYQLSVLIGDKGDPGPRGSTQMTSQGMKGEKGNDGLPGLMGPKGDTLHITLYTFTRKCW